MPTLTTIAARLVALGAIALLACLPAGCAEERTDAHTNELRLATTIPPLAWIAHGLAPEGATVSTLLPPGASEHGYEPPPSRVGAFASADVVLMVGMGLEPAADRILRSNPRGGRAVVVFANASGVAAQAAAAHAHSHDDHDHASHDDPCATDAHLWLDPPLMRDMVNETHDALARVMRRRAADDDALAALAARRDDLLARVDALHTEFAQRLAPFEGAAIVATHDAYRRFAARYNLINAGSLHAHEGAEPSPGAIRQAADALRAAPLALVFVEPQTARASADRLAAQTGASVVEFDPLGSGDWDATMRTNLDNLVRALEAARERPSR